MQNQRTELIQSFIDSMRKHSWPHSILWPSRLVFEHRTLSFLELCAESSPIVIALKSKASIDSGRTRFDHFIILKLNVVARARIIGKNFMILALLTWCRILKQLKFNSKATWFVFFPHMHEHEGRVVIEIQRNVKWLNGQKKQDHVGTRLTRFVTANDVKIFDGIQRERCFEFSIFFSAKYAYLCRFETAHRKKFRSEQNYSSPSPSYQ